MGNIILYTYINLYYIHIVLCTYIKNNSLKVPLTKTMGKTGGAFILSKPC